MSNVYKSTVQVMYHFVICLGVGKENKKRKTANTEEQKQRRKAVRKDAGINYTYSYTYR